MKEELRHVRFSDRRENHECLKPYCATCKRNVEIGNFCYMPTLKNNVPLNDNVLFVFYDFETTQKT